MMYCLHELTYNPHLLLGLHEGEEGQEIRLWRPGAAHVYLKIGDTVKQAEQIHPAGLFRCPLPSHLSFLDYRVYHHSGLLAADPYAFWPTFGEVDQYLFAKGVHYAISQKMGARVCEHQGVYGVKFAVWAPEAQAVALLADFNYWDERYNPMRSLGESGVWELFVPGIGTGEKYKFAITTKRGDKLIKSDPFAYAFEKRPSTASIVANISEFAWGDADWMQKRVSKNWLSSPMNIYEVHTGSWKKRHGEFLSYRELAHELAAYCQKMGYTHVELLPIQEHPLDESWGYQVSGFYAPTSRHGFPEDFQYFVNLMHQRGIGVILDWVPGHFPSDGFGLARFDGSALYEHADIRQGWHPHWNTLIFNFGRHEVSNFLLGSALHWILDMHVDGLRVDAVASMLYLDYGREEGDWIPNQYGGKENLEAIEFLKHLNVVVHEKAPGALMIAEESTAFAGITKPVWEDGLGFDFKWNMGWMNDTLRYFSKDPLFRSHHHQDLTFGLLYCFAEKFLSVLSHDEVVHGKKSLLAKMPGDVWQQFANLRLLFGYLLCQPGKKLLFMGGEIGQWNEWDCKREVEWELLRYPIHSGLHRAVLSLNHLYLHHPALWERDGDPSGFQWVDFSDTKNSVISYLRHSSAEVLLVVHHFTPGYYPHYRICLSGIREAKEIFNSDSAAYGGSGKINPEVLILKNEEGFPYALEIALAPLSTMIFQLL